MRSVFDWDLSLPRDFDFPPRAEFANLVPARVAHFAFAVDLLRGFLPRAPESDLPGVARDSNLLPARDFDLPPPEPVSNLHLPESDFDSNFPRAGFHFQIPTDRADLFCCPFFTKNLTDFLINFGFLQKILHSRFSKQFS